ncbi:MAG: preprotein translocase subunit YajC [Pseudomonadota bacterium]
MLISPAYAQAAATAPNPILQLLPLVAIFAIFYFLIIRPQQKRMKEHREMVAAVRRGDRVVTSGGIIGKVTKVMEDDKLTVEIADGVRVEVVKATLSDVLTKGEPLSSKDGGSSKDAGKAANDASGDSKADNA